MADQDERVAGAAVVEADLLDEADQRGVVLRMRMQVTEGEEHRTGGVPPRRASSGSAKRGDSGMGPRSTAPRSIP